MLATEEEAMIAERLMFAAHGVFAVGMDSLKSLVSQIASYRRPCEYVTRCASICLVIVSPNGAFAIANAIHKFDPRAATTEAYQSRLSALSCVRGGSEFFVSFESRFEASVCKARKSSGTVVYDAKSLLGVHVTLHARVYPAQKVSFLAHLATKSAKNTSSEVAAPEHSTAVGPSTSAAATATSNQSVGSMASSFQRNSTQLLASSIDEALSAIPYEDAATIDRASDMSSQQEYKVNRPQRPS